MLAKALAMLANIKINMPILNILPHQTNSAVCNLKPSSSLVAKRLCLFLPPKEQNYWSLHEVSATLGACERCSGLNSKWIQVGNKYLGQIHEGHYPFMPPPIPNQPTNQISSSQVWVQSPNLEDWVLRASWPKQMPLDLQDTLNETSKLRALRVGKNLANVSFRILGMPAEAQRAW